MLHLLLILNLIIIRFEVEPKKESDEDGDSDFGGSLAAQLRNDENLDLSEDEEYEDLRAEFLAYRTALASLTSPGGRRSMISTPCWRLGGICINNKLCTGFRSLSEVPGCKDKLKVCCFVWNQFKVRDMADHGIGSLAMPWNMQQDFGGAGVIQVEKTKKPRKRKERNPSVRSSDKNRKRIAIVIRT